VSLWAGGTAQAGAEPGDRQEVRLWDASGHEIGIPLGQTLSLDPGGAIAPAHLAASTRGYLFGVLASGAVGRVAELLHAGPDCTGPQYVRATGESPGAAVLPGSVFGPPGAGSLLYVPRTALAGPVRVASRSAIADGAAPPCQPLDAELPLLPALTNDPAVTGVSSASFSGPVAVAVTPVRGSPGGAPAGNSPDAALRHTRDLGPVRPDADGAPGPATADSLPASASEDAQCARGCFASELADGVCNPACYHELCAYDAGDCAGTPDIDERAAAIGRCAPLCGWGDVGDGFCDGPCNIQECRFDDGDCATGSVGFQLQRR
jgi:hypothetical protein